MNWRGTAWASGSLSWKAIFSILYVIPQVPFVFPVDSAVIQHRCNISPWSSSLQHWCTGHLSICPHCSPLALFPSSSSGHFSPNTVQPSSPSTSVSPLGSISEGTNSRMMLNSQTNPCPTLLYHTCHLQHPVPSSQPKHSTEMSPAVFATCPCSQQGPQENLMPQTTPGLTHPGARADATPPHNKEWSEMKSRKSQPLHVLAKSPPKHFNQLCWFPGTTAMVEKDTNPLRSSVLRQGHSCCSHSDTLPSPQAFRHQDCRR